MALALVVPTARPLQLRPRGGACANSHARGRAPCRAARAPLRVRAMAQEDGKSVDNSRVKNVLVDDSSASTSDGPSPSELLQEVSGSSEEGVNWANVGRRVVAWGPLTALTLYVASDLLKGMSTNPVTPTHL